MDIQNSWQTRQIAFALVIAMMGPVADAAPAPPRAGRDGSQARNSSGQAESVLPSPQVTSQGAKTDQLPGAYPDSPTAKPSGATSQSAEADASLPGQEQQQNPAPKPVGTAAAPEMKTTGVAASRPAGAAIAPGKQRRARSFLIRVSIVVGAAVAIGTVVGLSRASPSRPN
jgi:hypothetical protein